MLAILPARNDSRGLLPSVNDMSFQYTRSEPSSWVAPQPFRWRGKGLGCQRAGCTTGAATDFASFKAPPPRLQFNMPLSTPSPSVVKDFLGVVGRNKRRKTIYSICQTIFAAQFRQCVAAASAIRAGTALRLFRPTYFLDDRKFDNTSSKRKRVDLMAARGLTRWRFELVCRCESP